MNEEAYQKTLSTGKVTFYSRTRKTLWTKGETSGNFLDVVDIKNDCDNGISISFRRNESYRVVTFRLSNEETKEVYDLLNGLFDKKIRAAQKEFDEI